MNTIRLSALAPRREAILERRVRLIVAATITYNVAEGLIAITAGTVAGSAALVGFGLDSTIEVLSAAAVAWQFAGRDHRVREQTALRIVAFFSSLWPPTSPSTRCARSSEQPSPITAPSGSPSQR